MQCSTTHPFDMLGMVTVIAVLERSLDLLPHHSCSSARVLNGTISTQFKASDNSLSDWPPSQGPDREHSPGELSGYDDYFPNDGTVNPRSRRSGFDIEDHVVDDRDEKGRAQEVESACGGRIPPDQQADYIGTTGSTWQAGYQVCGCAIREQILEGMAHTRSASSFPWDVCPKRGKF